MFANVAVRGSPMPKSSFCKYILLLNTKKLEDTANCKVSSNSFVINPAKLLGSTGKTLSTIETYLDGFVDSNVSIQTFHVKRGNVAVLRNETLHI